MTHVRKNIGFDIKHGVTNGQVLAFIDKVKSDPEYANMQRESVIDMAAKKVVDQDVSNTTRLFDNTCRYVKNSIRSGKNNGFLYQGIFCVRTTIIVIITD